MWEIEARRIDGTLEPLAAYRGRTLLIVNVASRCGYTPQYAALEALYRRYKDDGFVVLGFPCDQFGRQEPGPEEEIAKFCTSRYDVTFPMFAKIEVNGPGAHPLYRYLTAARRGVLGTRRIKWNFTKFLIGPDGAVLRRYAPFVPPEKIEPAIAARVAPISAGDPPRTSRSR